MEELAEILSKYDRKKKFYRLRTGEFMDQHTELAVFLNQKIILLF